MQQKLRKRLLCDVNFVRIELTPVASALLDREGLLSGALYYAIRVKVNKAICSHTACRKSLAFRGNNDVGLFGKNNRRLAHALIGMFLQRSAYRTLN